MLRYSLYPIAGDNGDGLTNAAIGGIVITDLILGRHNDWSATYDPGRQFSVTHLKRALKMLPSYLKENLHDQMYYAKWVTRCRKTLTDIEDLVPGEGDVVRDGVNPVAVYKDPESGKLCKMSAVCPHMKAIVSWNKDEKSFDCPVHGSRFTCKGHVINGPATSDLTPMGNNEVSVQA
jgi:nitrite reductase/ring-hydroxylating ferredoxin subunit